MKNKLPTLILGLIISSVGNLVGQQAYDAIHILDREIGFGTRALALGGAYAGLANDYTATYWNPAGIGYFKQARFYAELSHLNIDNQALFANQRTGDTRTYTRFRSVGAAFPVPTTRGSLVLAIGVNRIRDFDDNLMFSGTSSLSNGLGFNISNENDESVYYPFDRNVRRFEQVSNEGGLNQWLVAAAVALSPRFMIGTTASIMEGDEDYRFRFIQTDVDSLYSQYPSDFATYQVNQFLKSKYKAVQVKVGGLIQVSHRIRIGGVMTLPSRFNVEEIHSFRDELVFDDGYTDVTENSGRWDYRVKTPFYFDGGISYSGRLLTLSAAARYRDWSQTRFEGNDRRIDDIEYLELQEENDIIRRNYGPATEYHLGGEITLSPLNTKLRGGYAYYPSPLRTARKEEDRKLYSGGLSYIIDENVSLDITYLRGSWERESRDQYTPGGTLESITFKKLLVGFSIGF